jgi:hypothetical protein
VSEYLLKYFPYEDLIIYEVGAGNGTFAANTLDWLRERYPEVYERTRYRIIEISGSMAENQRRALKDHSCVEVFNKSIFEWSGQEWAPCFVLALEVVVCLISCQFVCTTLRWLQDNFPHDIVRYHSESNEPYQTIVAVDEAGDFHEMFEPVRDPLLASYLTLRSQTPQPRPYSSRWHKLRSKLPFAANLSPPHFVPTRMYEMLMRLRTCFPRHRLLLSDFSTLPDAIEGHDAPVVQTRYRNETVPVTTYLVSPGYFDIFFPTDFELLREVYERVMLRGPHVADPGRPSPMTETSTSLELGSQFFFFRGRRAPLDGLVSTTGIPVGPRFSEVFTHKEFMETYADVTATKLRNGDNPLLDFYENVKYLF